MGSNQRALLWAPLFLSLLVACGGKTVEATGVLRDLRSGAPIANTEIRVAGEGEWVRTDENGRFTLSAKTGEQRFELRGGAHCDPHRDAPVQVSAEAEFEIFAAPIAEFPRDQIQAGYDEDIRVEVELNCAAEVRFVQEAGPSLGELNVEEGALRFHTPALATLVDLDARVGIVPIDRAARAAYVFRVEVEADERETLQEEVRVTAGAVTTGHFQVPTGTDIYLNGGDGSEHEWRMVASPGETVPIVDAGDRIAHFRAPEFGPYVVRHEPTMTEFMINAGPYHRIRNDCGRSACHGEQDQGWRGTAHARTMRRGLEGDLGEEFNEECWECHANGVELGVQNGGLHMNPNRRYYRPSEPHEGAYEELPRGMRQYASVWCSDCHGPGRIVPPASQWQYGAKFGVGVCAQCHDVNEDDPNANHVSNHVDEWRVSPMSTFIGELNEQNPALRRGCASCHTAEGFSHWRNDDTTRFLPNLATVQPVTCPTCHNPHGGDAPQMLRVHGSSDPLDGQPVDNLGNGAICATCHRSEAVEDPSTVAFAPHAPQLDMLLGRGARGVNTANENPHRQAEGSCVSCHMEEASGELEGIAGGHTFLVRGRGTGPINQAACAQCHQESDPEQIGARDWDGDGESGTLTQEMRRLTRAIEAALERKLAGTRDSCSTPHEAVGVRDQDGLLVLVDAEGHVLGDCDENGVLLASERVDFIRDAPERIRNAAYNLLLLRRDGSNGRHNPNYAFEIGRQALRSLR